jgi:hypothetical protein
MAGLGTCNFNEKKYKKFVTPAEDRSCSAPAQEAPAKMRRLDIGGLGFDRQLYGGARKGRVRRRI